MSHTRTSPLRLLFVCSGNLHRSVMSAAISQAMFEELGDQAPPFVIASAGTLNLQGQHAPREVQTVCAEIGIDVSHHRSQGLTRSLITHSERVIVMSEAHGDRVLDLETNAEDKLIFLGDYFTPPGDVFDPIGQDVEQFRQSRDSILAALQRLFPELLPRR